MMVLRQTNFSRRDAILLLVGAFVMHLWSLCFTQQQTIFIDAAHPRQTLVVTQTSTASASAPIETPSVFVADGHNLTSTDLPDTSIVQVDGDHLPDTSVLAHAPGWTLFRNLYMSNGTLYLIANQSHRSEFPEIRLMASHPLEAKNTPENIAAREPSDLDITFITPEEAQSRWGDRIFSVQGSTLLSNDPKQFLRHYYHFVAELFFGVQAFWHGFFSLPTDNSHFSVIHPPPPPIDRLIFAYANADGWRDDPGFNAYFLRATLPSLSVEHEEDWNDRVQATRSNTRAWRFSLVLLTDRSAAHRGTFCGAKTQRTAAEPWTYMRLKGKLKGLHVGGWWAPLREAMWKFAGADAEFHNLGSSALDLQSIQPNIDSDTTTAAAVEDISPEAQNQLPMPEKIVLTYIDRQGAHLRNFVDSDLTGLIQAIEELVARKNEERMAILKQEGQKQVPLEWEFNIMQAGKLSKDEQVKIAARTTIMFGIHGNGLTHLLWMQPNRLSTVIEMFCPLGFAHDYYWTAKALGMAHITVWNDTYVTYPEKPRVKYPDCFQSKQISVDGPTVAKLIEDRVSGSRL